MEQSPIAEFRLLLDTSSSEADVQAFLEKHPWMLTVHSRTVVTQLPLGSEYRVDFAYSRSANAGHFLSLIEIERPDMEVFNANDEFSQPFNHAVQQVIDWNEWCTRNPQYLADLAAPLFGSLDDGYKRYPGFLYPRIELIAGRRSQLSNKRRKSRFVARANSLQRTMTILTYDDFLDSMDIPSAIPDVVCVRYNNQRFS
jgi:hypothetical protein